MDRVRGQGSLARLVLASFFALAAACRSRPAGEGPYADKVAKAMDQIESTLGVKFKQTPRLELRSRDSVRAYLVREFDKEKNQQDLAGEEAAYKVFGMIPDTMHLREFLIDALTGQIAGYYDPETKVFYVTEGMPDDKVGATIPHELVHALQDQYGHLDSIRKSVRAGDDDRATAMKAVIEGEAQYAQIVIAAGGAENIATRLPGVWDQMREMTSEAIKSDPKLAAAPAVITESFVLFPYINGSDFARRYAQRHPGLFPLDSAPVSTEQVIHDQAYFGEKRDAPTPISLPPIPGAVYSNNLGEFGARLFIYQHLRDSNGAIRAAAGWDGDRYVVYRTPAGMAVAWATVWDTPLDAAEFVTTTTEAMRIRYGGTPTTQGGARALSAQGRVVRLVQREIDGRDVVLFTDVPAGQESTAPDIARVRLGT